ncbi:MAG: hypothetical protein KC549_10730, partial [Myxococcales bacterium]|nr:hypothetical protein [Myxococcales bacterium]
ALAALPFVWRDVWWRRAWTLIWPGLIAAPFGAVLVWSLPEPALLLLVGLLRRRLALLLALLPFGAQAHVPADLPPEGTEALASDALLVDLERVAVGPYADAALSPDGTRLLLIHRDGQTLSVVDARPGATPRVLATVGTRGAAWYPDGRGVSVLTPDQALSAVPVIGLDLAGTLEVPRVAPPVTRVGIEAERAFVEEAGTRYPISAAGERAFRAVASPDGEHVVIWRLHGGLALLRLADGLVVPLGGGHPRFDAAGRYLVFERTRDEGLALVGGDVFVLPLAAARPTPRALTATADRIELAPSLAADRVSFVTSTGEVWTGRLPETP